MVGRCTAICVAVAAVFGPVCYYTVKQAGNESLAQWHWCWYGDESVREGGVYLRGNTYLFAWAGNVPTVVFLNVFRYAFLALLGEVYFPSVMKVADFDFRKESDAEGQFCRSLLDYFWVFPSHPMNRGNRQDMNDFVSYCREEWQKLSNEEKMILEPWHGSGRVPNHLLLPAQQNPDMLTSESRRQGPAPYAAEKMPMEEVHEVIRESISKSTWDGVVPEIPDAIAEHYAKLDLRKVPQVPGKWEEIRKALEGGRIVGFDATKLFPKELFNATPSTLAGREGPDAQRIPILSDMCTAISLHDWGRQVDKMGQRGARAHFNLADGVSQWGAPHPDINGEQKRIVDFKRLIATQNCDTGYIHTRRMPKLHATLPDVVAEAGMQDDVVRVQSYLWMGALRGGFHYDEEANIYVQLTGEADVWLIHQNFTRPYGGGKRVEQPPSPQRVLTDPYVKQVPIHIFRIKAGEGLVFPAYTYHLFNAQSPERVALNFFFMPKWRKMEYAEADWYTQEAKGPNGLVRLALRQIWTRSFARLWDEKKRGLVVNSFKNEYL